MGLHLGRVDCSLEYTSQKNFPPNHLHARQPHSEFLLNWQNTNYCIFESTENKCKCWRVILRIAGSTDLVSRVLCMCRVVRLEVKPSFDTLNMFQENQLKPDFSPNGPFPSNLQNRAPTVRRSLRVPWAKWTNGRILTLLLGEWILLSRAALLYPCFLDRWL